MTSLRTNPFRGLNPGTFADATQPEIDLVDGGELRFHLNVFVVLSFRRAVGSWNQGLRN